MRFWVWFRFRGKVSVLARRGPDFAVEELQELERIARRVATLRPEILFAHPKKPRWKLELQNEQKKKPKADRRLPDRTV